MLSGGPEAEEANFMKIYAILIAPGLSKIGHFDTKFSYKN